MTIPSTFFRELIGGDYISPAQQRAMDETADHDGKIIAAAAAIREAIRLVRAQAKDHAGDWSYTLAGLEDAIGELPATLQAEQPKAGE